MRMPRAVSASSSSCARYLSCLRVLRSASIRGWAEITFQTLESTFPSSTPCPPASDFSASKNRRGSVMCHRAQVFTTISRFSTVFTLLGSPSHSLSRRSKYFASWMNGVFR